MLYLNTVTKTSINLCKKGPNTTNLFQMKRLEILCIKLVKLLLLFTDKVLCIEILNLKISLYLMMESKLNLQISDKLKVLKTSQDR